MQFYNSTILWSAKKFLRFPHTILQLHNPMVCQDNFKISSYNSTNSQSTRCYILSFLQVYKSQPTRNCILSSLQFYKLTIHKKLYAFLSTILQIHNPQDAVYFPLYDFANYQRQYVSSLQFYKLTIHQKL